MINFLHCKLEFMLYNLAWGKFFNLFAQKQLKISSPQSATKTAFERVIHQKVEQKWDF